MGRQSAVLMLAVVVMWTALPGFACFLSMPRPASQPSCCAEMAQDSGSMTAMNAAEVRTDGSCCRAHEKVLGLVPVLPYAPEQLQRLAVAPDPLVMPDFGRAGRSFRAVFETLPPRSSSGASSPLRV